MNIKVTARIFAIAATLEARSYPPALRSRGVVTPSSSRVFSNCLVRVMQLRLLVCAGLSQGPAPSSLSAIATVTVKTSISLRFDAVRMCL